MRYFLTYSDNLFFRERQLQLSSQMKDFFFPVMETRNQLKNTIFYQKFKDILDMPRGGGYWLWKPYLISSLLEDLDYNDIILYLDCGDKVNSSIFQFIESWESLDEDCIFTSGVSQQKDFTKGDCFHLMDCKEDRFYNRRQIEAGIILIKKTDLTVSLVKEWLKFCENPHILTDFSNLYMDNLPNFIDHRHDQSVLTNLLEKYQIPTCERLRNYITCNV